jgi:hypothetical protein
MVHQWLARYESGVFGGLTDRSHRPRGIRIRCPRQPRTGSPPSMRPGMPGFLGGFSVVVWVASAADCAWTSPRFVSRCGRRLCGCYA